ncbi:MAG: hypothetical protein ACYDEY_10300 [Acidimicrobiales bacterium]
MVARAGLVVGLLAGMLLVLGGGAHATAALGAQTADSSSAHPSLPPVSLTNPVSASNLPLDFSRRVQIQESPRPPHLRSPEAPASASGAGWHVSKSYPSAPYANGIACPSTTTCYAVGQNGSGGVILATSNSGTTWTSQSVPSGTSDLIAVACPSVTTCYAVGQNSSGGGLILSGPGGPACSSTGVGSPFFPSGYWLAGANGAVYSCGDAPFYGSLVTLGVTLAHPIVGIAATPDAKGYWLVASDGGLFAFGDARFYGSMGGKPLNKPVVGMASTPEGGYYEVASDGGLFAFGPGAVFHGSMGGKPLNKPVVGMASTPEGGYYEVASDGGLFAFGAPFHGSPGCLGLTEPITAMVASSDTSTVGTGAACYSASRQAPGGYRFAAGDGGVFSFGNAVFAGSLAGEGVSGIVGIANS